MDNLTAGTVVQRHIQNISVCGRFPFQISHAPLHIFPEDAPVADKNNAHIVFPDILKGILYKDGK